MVKILEADAANLLEFMKANGLVANPGKTAFILLNANKEAESKVQLRIGNTEVENQMNAKYWLNYWHTS